MAEDDKKGLSVRVDVTSGVAESLIDGAKAFLGKLISPAVGEIGLLVKDQVTYFRFKNQVKILNRAEHYCLKHNITLKAISMKLLCPLIENASLEDDEYLQDKWAVLISNLVDSEQNIDNHVFPYLLSQISKDEFLIVEKTYLIRINMLDDHDIALKRHKKSNSRKLIRINKELEPLNDKIRYLEDQGKSMKDPELYKLLKERQELSKPIRALELQEDSFKYSKLLPSKIINGLKGYEISNLVRLGLIKEGIQAKQKALAYPDELSIPFYFQSFVEPTDSYLTSLGEAFIQACLEKKNS